MDKSRIYIGQSAKYLDVSVDTLRRWDKSGKLLANKSKGGQRWYLKKDLDFFKFGVFELAKSWITGDKSSKNNKEGRCYYFMNKQQNPVVIALIVAGAFLGYRVLTGKFE